MTPAQRLCSVEGCGRVHAAAGFCHKHLYRFRKHGDAAVRYPTTPAHERVLARVVRQPNGCLEYQGSLRLGYGRVGLRLDGRKAVREAHRVVYEGLIGPIPEGLDIDHLCRNRRCVNVAHLEPVTRAENLRRGREARGMSA